MVVQPFNKGKKQLYYIIWLKKIVHCVVEGKKTTRECYEYYKSVF